MNEVRPLADLVLIDGEHTTVAAFSDFISLLPACAPDVIFMFHDANLVFDGIIIVERFLQHIGTAFNTVFLPDCLAAIGLGSAATLVREEFADLAMARTAYLELSKAMLRQSVIDEAVRRGRVVPFDLASIMRSYVWRIAAGLRRRLTKTA